MRPTMTPIHANTRTGSHTVITAFVLLVGVLDHFTEMNSKCMDLFCICTFLKQSNATLWPSALWWPWPVIGHYICTLTSHGCFTTNTNLYLALILALIELYSKNYFCWQWYLGIIHVVSSHYNTYRHSTVIRHKEILNCIFWKEYKMYVHLLSR